MIRAQTKPFLSLEERTNASCAWNICPSKRRRSRARAALRVPNLLGGVIFTAGTAGSCKRVFFVKNHWSDSTTASKDEPPAVTTLDACIHSLTARWQSLSCCFSPLSYRCFSILTRASKRLSFATTTIVPFFSTLLLCRLSCLFVHSNGST